MQIWVCVWTARKSLVSVRSRRDLAVVGWRQSVWLVCAEVSSGLRLQILVRVSRVGISYGSDRVLVLAVA
ncbi:unnamed protein product [Brassica rapa]|uniref:Uncharacterized protein n=2 Tax=Brassica TaxID=3705 RepID=A0A3P5ZTX1_BRACM|nr:unnamed protein product [Brassica napus]CAG7888417.1 unnamed protein product [Brassica rapa]VDC75840.1 unnamed protein product [Brassica rapa]